MRLTESERSIIKRILTETFGNDSFVYLFGSRADDSKRGGDIDLLVESPGYKIDEIQRIHAITCIQKKIGLKKIDLIVTGDSSTDLRIVVKEAIKTGIRI